MNGRKVNTLGAATAFLLFASASAMADQVLLSSTFDDLGTPGTSTLNFTGFQNIAVTSGSVDLVNSGDFGISCFGGSGKCVDLVGTGTGATGAVTIPSLVALPNGDYTLSFELSGNQRGQLSPGPDLLTLSIGTLTKTFTKGPNDPGDSPGNPFELITVPFTVSAQNPVNSLVFSSLGATNNIGLILDNATISAVPLPATAPLFLSAFAALSAFYRRRIGAKVA